MPFSVPLILEKSIAVVHRLNVAATDGLTPYVGATGYDKDFKEPATYDLTAGQSVQRTGARIEFPEIRVPCQVERARFELLNQQPPGDSPSTSIALVLHRRDLKRLKLIDVRTDELLLEKNDRISSIESSRRKGHAVIQIEPPGLYIWELGPGSFGFGDDGHDLILAYLSVRERAR